MKIYSICLVLAACTVSRAAIVPAPLFSDFAILQRDKQVPVWGKATPGEKVTVEFSGQSRQTVANDAGRWQVMLDAMPASTTESTMRLSGDSGTLEIKGLLVGDVWFASGQSNMQHVVRKTLNAEAEAAAADYPQIRMFKVWFNVSESPLDALTGKPSKWTLCRPNSVSSFSAVGYYFARELHRELKVPIGIVHSSWGGTPIESWMSASSLNASPLQPKIAQRWKQFLADYEVQFARYQKAVQAWEKAEQNKAPGSKPSEKPREPQGAVSRWTPSGLFNAMVHPFIPYGLRGFIWYQGEANTARYDEYGSLFKTLITDWRKDFAQGDLPFYFVQIANFDHKVDTTGRTWAFLREAQLEALNLPNTGAAITVDIGNPNDAHYANKQEAGRRLAALALSRLFGKTVDDSGPIFDRAVVEDGRMRVSFKGTEDLVLKPEQSNSFELAGDDKTFRAATAVLDGRSLVITSPQVPHPVAVRYAWRNAPATSIFDSAGLPAPPFRSDNWTPVTPVDAGAPVSDSGNDAGN